MYVLPSSQDTNLYTYKNKPLNCSLCSTKTSTFSLSYCCSFVTIVPNMLFFTYFHFKRCTFPEYINKPTKCTSLFMLVMYILYTIIYTGCIKMIGVVLKLIVFTSMVNRIINSSRNERLTKQVYDTYLQMFDVCTLRHTAHIEAIVQFLPYSAQQVRCGLHGPPI